LIGMPSFAYIGDHAQTALFGVRFVREQPTEVTDPRAVAKLRGNSHFVESFDGAQVLDAAPAEPAAVPEKRRGRPPGRREAA
jgi:hypothetical protein